MRKKALFISLALALVLTTLMPATTLAAPPKFVDFEAIGTITYITPGDVAPAGDSGRWRVIERELGGVLTGDINGAYTLNYKANVELATQAGNLRGTLETGAYSIGVNGTIEPLQFYDWYYIPDFGYVPLYYLKINGQWTIVDGAQGNGDFTAYAIFIPTPDGHVSAIVNSAFVMTGKWKP